MSEVLCNSCQKTSVPRLLHRNPIFSHLLFIRLRYSKTQHICPFCGTCMYETGGEFTLLAKFLFFYFAIPGVIIDVMTIKHQDPVYIVVPYIFCISVMLWWRPLTNAYKKISN
jgi:hypothetical protein